MIEHLFNRKIIREFLKKYSINQWPQVISDVFEIGVLNLQNSFHTMYYTKETFQTIISKQYSIMTLLDDLKAQLNIKLIEDTASKKKIAQTATKPSKGWRCGDPPEYKNQISKDTIKRNKNSNNNDYDYNHQNRNNTEEVYYSDREIKRNKNRKTNKKGGKGKGNHCTGVNNWNDNEMQNRSRSGSKSRPRINYQVDPNEIKEKNKEHNLKVQSIESKIKAEVSNDKTTYHFVKNQTGNNNYEGNNDVGEANSKESKQENKKCNGNKVNYAINYDKNLKPESIQKKTKQNEEVVYCKKKDKQLSKKTPAVNKLTDSNEPKDNKANNEANEYEQNQIEEIKEGEQEKDKQQVEENSNENYVQGDIDTEGNINNMENNDDQIREHPQQPKLQQVGSNPILKSNKPIASKNSSNNKIIENKQLIEENQYKSLDNSENDNENSNYNISQSNNYYNERNTNNDNLNLYYENQNHQNDYAKYKAYPYKNKNNLNLNMNTNSQYDNNANYSNNYEENEYQSLSNSERNMQHKPIQDQYQYQNQNQFNDQDHNQVSPIQEENDKVNGEGGKYQYNHIDDLVKEPNYNHQDDLPQLQYLKQPSNIENNKEYSQNNSRTYQYHQAYDNKPQYHPNSQIGNQYSNNRNAYMFMNRQYQHMKPLQLPQPIEMNNHNNRNTNEQVINDNQYSEAEEYNYNSNDISFKQSDQDNNYFKASNQDNEGQLSMLNLSDRTKQLFKREMNHWVPQGEEVEEEEDQRQQEQQQSNSNNNSNSNSNNHNHSYYQNRYAYQMEAHRNTDLSS